MQPHQRPSRPPPPWQGSNKGDNQCAHRYRRSGQLASGVNWVNKNEFCVKQAALRACIAAALAVSTASLLAPQAASALDFTFSFAGVSGLIENLVEGPNTCDATSSCIVKVTNNGGTGAATGTYFSQLGFQFFVGGGVVVSWVGNGTADAWPAPGGSRLDLGAPSSLAFGVCSDPRDCPSTVSGPVTFSPAPASSVSGPLPLFGAAAAFGFSRKLMNRIKVTRTTAPTRPAD